MNKSYKHYLLAWVIFFLIAIGLGYQSMTRYDPAQSSLIDDVVIYSEIVKNGIDGITFDHRSTRVLVPLISRPIYLVFDGHIGLWNPVQFSLLFVASFFCASIVLLMIAICKRLFYDDRIGILAGLIFYVNFTVPNLYLSGLVDSAEAFFFLLLIYVLITKKLAYIPIIAILGVLSKETFFPVGFIVISVWWIYEYFIDKELNLSKVFNLILFALLSIFILTVLKSYALNEVSYLWDFSGNMKKDVDFDFERTLIAIRRFLYAYIWLLPLSLIRILSMPKPWLIAAICSSIAIFIMGNWIGASGAAISRYMFNILGPFLSISCAIFVIKYKSK